MYSMAQGFVGFIFSIIFSGLGIMMAGFSQAVDFNIIRYHNAVLLWYGYIVIGCGLFLISFLYTTRHIKH